jgi:hypothetical protein
MSFLSKIAISCKQATYLHEKRREGKLDALEGLGLWIHLLYCRFCKLFIKQVQLLETASHKLYQTAETKFHLTPNRKAELQKAFEKELKKQ